MLSIQNASWDSSSMLPYHISIFTVAAKASGFIMKAAFGISCQKLVFKIRCQTSCWWGIINICSSLLYAVALQSRRVPGKTISDINLILRGLLELLDETGGNRGKVIIAKQWLPFHHALLMLEQGMDNFHWFIFLINDSYEAIAALGELLAEKPFETDDYIRISPLEGSKTLAASSSQIMLYSRMFQKGF